MNGSGTRDDPFLITQFEYNWLTNFLMEKEKEIESGTDPYALRDARNILLKRGYFENAHIRVIE